MRVVIPFVPTLNPDVARAINAGGYIPDPVDVSGSDDAYWTLLHRLWGRGKTICIVEHDVIVRPDSLRELEECPSDWCSFQVPYVGRLYAGLSCAKFSAALIARYPDALERISELSDDEHPQKHWCRIDSWLQGYVLHPGGETMCVHTPPLEHIRENGDHSPTHGCGE
jgi:hypothetical protein